VLWLVLGPDCGCGQCIEFGRGGQADSLGKLVDIQSQQKTVSGIRDAPLQYRCDQLCKFWIGLGFGHDRAAHDDLAAGIVASRSIRVSGRSSLVACQGLVHAASVVVEFRH